MSSKVANYERLPGRGSGAMGFLRTSRCTLWLGPDHLLFVDNHGYSEDYKRFFLKDIQAITVVRTATGTVWAWVLGAGALLGALLMLLALALDWHLSVTITGSIIAGFFLLCLLVNRLRGPTCNCCLRTAVQTERIYSLNHQRRALKVTARLRELVEATQGSLTPEQTAELHAASVAAVQAAAQPVPVAVFAGPDATRQVAQRPYGGRAHAVLVGVLLADLLYEVLQLFSPGRGIFLIGILISIALVTSTVIALIRQHSTTLPHALKVITWISMAYLFVSYTFGSIYSAVFMMSNPELAGNTWKAAQAVANVSPLESPVRLAMTIFSICCSGGLGLTGALLLASKKQQRQPAPPPGEG